MVLLPVEWVRSCSLAEEKIFVHLIPTLSGSSLHQFLTFVTFLACPRKVTQRRAPGGNSLRHAQSSLVHFGNSPFGSDSPKCLTRGLNRMPKFPHGTAFLDLKPNPHVPGAALTIFLGTRLGPKVASQRANANCLRPQAEFSRASGRGLRRVKNVVQDAKGMCKK